MARNNLIIAIIVGLILVGGGILFLYTSNSKVVVYNFATCVKAGNAVMESYPRQCLHEGITYVEDVTPPAVDTHVCTDAERGAAACIQIYQPACGWFNPEINCIKYPCASTYSNSCVACKEQMVAYLTQGECPRIIGIIL